MSPDAPDVARYGEELYQRIKCADLEILDIGRGSSSLHIFAVRGTEEKFLALLAQSPDAVGIEPGHIRLVGSESIPELGGKPRPRRTRPVTLLGDWGTSYGLERQIESLLLMQTQRDDAFESLQHWRMPLRMVPLMKRVQAHLIAKSIPRFRGTWTFDELETLLLLSEA